MGTQPDIVLSRWDQGAAPGGIPDTEDILLVIEVSDSTLRYDLTRKLRLYAGKGIPEFWDWDIPHRRVLVYWNPAGGGYQEQFVATAGDVLEVAALPGVRVDVAGILPAPQLLEITRRRRAARGPGAGRYPPVPAGLLEALPAEGDIVGQPAGPG